MLLLLLPVFLFLAPNVAAAENPESSFDAANKLYAEGKFTEAASEYGKIIQSGRASAALYFNLGNAFFKAGQMGRAILAYRHARAISPRDPDVIANLQFTRNQVQGPTWSLSPLARWLGKLSLNEWTASTAASGWLCFLLLILGQLRPALRPAVRGWALTLAIVTLFLGACLGAQLYRSRLQQNAVIIAPQAQLHQAPLDNSPISVTLHDGAEVRILDRKGDWLQVSTDPSRVGWISPSQAVIVAAD